MRITLNKIGKKFQHEWVFKNINYTFQQGQTYAITGPNGSGKSTLLQIISGMLPASEGTIAFTENEKEVEPSHVFRCFDFVAPYQELIEEFTLSEFLDFHFSFKKLKEGLTKNELVKLTMLDSSMNKQIRNFSSGMKQRLKLSLAFFSQSPVLLLDEPTSNLDELGFNWYMKFVQKQKNHRTIIISSNQPQEYIFCENIIAVKDFK